MLDYLGGVVFFALIWLATMFYQWAFGALGWVGKFSGWAAFGFGAATVLGLIGGITLWSDGVIGRKKRDGDGERGTSLAVWRGGETKMIKPTDTTSYVNNEVDTPTPDGAPADTDILETMQPGVAAVTDSASSAADAGLIDPTLEDAEDLTIYREMDEETPDMEIPMSDLDYREPQLHSPVMGSMNAPGEVDIEELDEETVREALPPDARLDPLED